MMTNTKMTIYNRCLEPFTHRPIYKKHVVENVFWDDSLGINTNMGHENADKVNVYIPFDKNDLTDYKQPKQFNGEGWTLQNGDFMVKGDIDIDNINGIKDLSQYDAFVMTICDNKDFGSPNMQHFELRGN